MSEPLEMSAPETDHMTCSCGSSWWIVPVAFEPTGNIYDPWEITAYGAVVNCLACGAEQSTYGAAVDEDTDST